MTGGGAAAVVAGAAEQLDARLVQGAEPSDVHPVLRMQDHRRDHPSLQSSWQSTQRRVVLFTGPATTFRQNPGIRDANETTARPVTSLRPAQQDARPALARSRPVHHIRPYAIRQQRLYADTRQGTTPMRDDPVVTDLVIRPETATSRRGTRSWSGMPR